MRQYLFLILTTLFLFSCDKEEFIEYPDNGDHGLNILSLESGSHIANNTYHSLRANVPVGKDLKIVIKNTSDVDTSSMVPSGGQWFYPLGENENWAISSYENNQQTFKSTEKNNDVSLIFENSGSCEILIYENSETITKTLIINW